MEEEGVNNGRRGKGEGNFGGGDCLLRRQHRLRRRSLILTFLKKLFALNIGEWDQLCAQRGDRDGKGGVSAGGEVGCC